MKLASLPPRGLACALLLAACGGGEPPAPDVVARIADEEIRYPRFEAYLQQAVGDPDAVLTSDVLTALFDQFLDEQLLVRLAQDREGRAGAKPGPGGRPLAAAPQPARRAIEALLAADRGAEPGEAESLAYYDAHRADFARPERVLLRQILVEERAVAEQALGQIAAGAEFQEVARSLSRDASAGFGGFQGELSRADLPPDFAEVIFALREGEVSRVIPADYGFHIFQVVRRLPAAVAPYEAVREEIRDRLRQQRADRRLAALAAEARKRYDVEVYPRNVPFNYEGSYAPQTDHPR
ncbi:MAG TPA: peptidylprolyl isomerase [Thermoanaerobaculia bacterium]|nr:peptidylprolyl isomerase [Thermoanaerobaculia bacterium]